MPGQTAKSFLIAQQILATNAFEILVRWDPTEIQGGERWWQAITESIDAAECAVLVLTPKAPTSDMSGKNGVRATPRRMCNPGQQNSRTGRTPLGRFFCHEPEIE